VATARTDDEEMALRVEEHRRSRPGSWTVVEEPIDVHSAIETAGISETLLIDCVTLWISNLMVERDDSTILTMVEEVVAGIVSRPGHTIVVSNEVGDGLVPMNAVGRRFRDLHGRANQVLAEVADVSFLVVAGRVLQLGDHVDVV
jgi:adenosylcobinamide kinase/adenosylcobinamide-phosphate guanylyltransferase